MNDGLALWGGLECTVNRVRDTYFSQLQRSGHATRAGDLERFASLGIKALRYPVLWEQIAPKSVAQADWSWTDARLPRLRELGVTLIAGLLHHGSGPLPDGLLAEDFPERLAEFAEAVACRYPSLTHYTPVNEPNTTARFSGLYGVWHPHATDDQSYVRALLNQCRGVVLAMRAVRRINPIAQLVQTDDLGKSHGTPAMGALVEFYDARRWLSWDLLSGKVVAGHALWEYLLSAGATPSELIWFTDNACPPDVIGINYYVTSERWLDERVGHFPAAYHCEWYGQRLADIEAARALAEPLPGIGVLMKEAWQRYRLPLAVTEAHIDSTRDDQMRWLDEIWSAARQARANGIDVRAVTVWALLGSYDWNCLVTENRGYYEPGPFDVRAAEPRPTAVARLMRELAARRRPTHPVLQGLGWWRRPGRCFCEPVKYDAGAEAMALRPAPRNPESGPPLLVIGAKTGLGGAFAALCEQRHLHYRLLGPAGFDACDAPSIACVLAREQPWAVIDAAGRMAIDEAERDIAGCLRENVERPSALAHACAAHGVQFLTFSSDLVFDGARDYPYVETDPVAPLNVFGRSKVQAERQVLHAYPDALVVRTGALFGQWRDGSVVARGLTALANARPFVAPGDLIVSPTYVPDLVHACLDLLIDGVTGVVHLSNKGAATWADFAMRAAAQAGLDTGLVQARPARRLRYVATRPGYRVLGSERASVLPSLESALSRYVQHWPASCAPLAGAVLDN